MVTLASLDLFKNGKRFVRANWRGFRWYTFMCFDSFHQDLNGRGLDISYQAWISPSPVSMHLLRQQCLDFWSTQKSEEQKA